MTLTNTHATTMGRPTSTPALTAEEGKFLRYGRPHQVFSGSLHYFRVHPDQWADRLNRLAAMGLNTVDTYVAWNFHERRRGAVDFTGWRDLGRFIDLAGEAGLDVIVRPGPYICAEWDNGGFPAWVTNGKTGFVRTSDPSFTDAVQLWFETLMPILERRQSSHGGPIVAVQVENEYGSYGDDKEYLLWLRQLLVDHGITELLYTADGPTDLMLDGGTLDGTLASATFGSRVAAAAEAMAERRPQEPFLCAEFWNGWFDHWGENHHTRDPENATQDLREIVTNGGSVSIYMAHGGTNFGLWSGANVDGFQYQPTITSYDSDAPIAENGALRPKFHAFRHELLGAAAGTLDPALAVDPPTLDPATAPINVRRGLLPALRQHRQPVSSVAPLSFEDLELDAGLVVYSSNPVLPRGTTTIRIPQLRDRAWIFLDGQLIAAVDHADAAAGITCEGRGKAVDLEILVENQGRINYGHRLGEGKGILGGVLIDRRLTYHWRQIPVPLADFTATDLAGMVSGPDPAPVTAATSGLAEAVLDVEAPHDTFLALPGFGKGFVWINGFLLGRYWEVGPQRTLYLPAPLLRSGRNEVVILELERFGTHIEFRDSAELGPPEEYIESL